MVADPSICLTDWLITLYRLAGLVVKAYALGAGDPGSNPACDGIFPGLVIPVT